MKALGVLLAALTALGMVVMRQAAVPTDAFSMRHVSPAANMAGTISALRTTSGAGVILLRASEGQLHTLRVTKRTQFRTHDGSPLTFADLRPGDQVRVRSAQQIQDLSQRSLTLHGVVSSAPLLGGPITILSDKGQAILVDADGQTDYTDRSHETSGLAELVEADIVHLQGLYDSTLGEMTETRSIVRLGPIPRKPQQSGSSG